MAKDRVRSQAVILGDNLLAASTGVRASSNAIILREWEGWDEAPEFERQTAPRLFGDGEIYSRLTYQGSKRFSFTMFAKYPESTNVRTIRTQLMKIAERLNDGTNVSMVYYENEKVTMKEVLSCLPDSPFIEDWVTVNNGVEFRLNFWASQPWKTIYLNGKTTAESRKRL